MDKGNGNFEKHKWTASVENYILLKNNIKIPSKMKAIWNLDSGDFEYFNGNLKDILYDYKTAD